MDYIEILKAVLLGLVQGLTEFLPVSSSGHLLLLEKLGVLEPSLFFNVMLHAGTLLAVVIVYFKRLTALVLHPFKNKLYLYVIACVPTGLIAVAAERLAPALFDGAYLPLFFMITAAVLFSAEFFKPVESVAEIRPASAALSGTAQGIAVLPGISRSGATISALMLMGVPREKAADFSFILSVPIIIVSCVYECVKLTPADVTVSAAAVAAGVAAAFVSGLAAIKFMLKLVRKKNFYPFAIYMFLLSILSFILL